jgi:RHS repeat-associated protein
LTSTDANGHLTSLIYDTSNRGLVVAVVAGDDTSAEALTVSNYDPAGQLTASQDGLGAVTSYVYDPVNRLTQTTDALGDVSLSAYDQAGQLTASRDALGHWTQYGYNLRGWQTSVTDPTGAVSTSAYDRSGNVTASTDPLNDTTSYNYDKVGRQTSVSDPLGHTTTTGYDQAGNVTFITDALSHQITYAYDKGNRQTSETDAAGTSLARTITTGYDAVGNVTTSTDGLGHTTSYAYDQDNRQVSITDPLSHVSTTQYDAAGNVTATIDALNQTTSYVYDGLNRQIAVTNALGNTTTSILDANGQPVATIDPLLDVSQTVYDPLGRPVYTLDGRGDVNQTIYDAGGNVAEIVDAAGNQTTYLYDKDNREILHTDPYGKSVTTAYDLAGRVTSVVDRDNRTISYAYDAANRETSETWLSSTGSTVNLRTYTYDNTNKLLTAADNSGTYTMGYDQLNRETFVAEPFGVSLTYAYDLADRRTLVQDSLGGLLTSVYDNADRLTSRKLTAGTLQVRLDPGYNNRNDMTSLTRFSNVSGTTVVGTTVYGFDNGDRLTAITNKNASGTTLSFYNDAYDTADRVTSETFSSTVGTTVYSGTKTYTYDRASQLLSDGTKTYAYDNNGNRTTSGTQTYQTAADNRLSTDGIWTYTYDNEGNLIQKTKGSGGSLVTWKYAYDNLNKLVSAVEITGGTTTAVQATYIYDIFGNRIEEDKYLSSSGLTTITRHAYDGQNVWADLDHTNAMIARYVYGDGVDEMWARAIPSGQTNPGVAWYLTDHLGSIRDLMDNTGALQDHLDYDGYGNVTESKQSYGDRYKFTAREYDYDTGLQYNWARYYDTATGRWTEEDPLGFQAGDSNLFRYVTDDPVNAGDPLGLQAASAQALTVSPAGTFLGNNGSFLSAVTFRLRQPAANGGIILQAVSISSSVTYGLERGVMHPALRNMFGARETPTEPHISYLEIWQVRPGQRGTDPVSIPAAFIKNQLGNSGFIRTTEKGQEKVAYFGPAEKTQLRAIRANDFFTLLVPIRSTASIGTADFIGNVWFIPNCPNNAAFDAFQRQFGFIVGVPPAVAAAGKVSPAVELPWHLDTGFADLPAILAALPGVVGPVQHNLWITWDYKASQGAWNVGGNGVAITGDPPPVSLGILNAFSP